MERRLVTCPNCNQQFDEEIDGYDCIITLICMHVVCISCSHDHIPECRDYWIARRFGNNIP
jgi:hypothetical protein